MANFEIVALDPVTPQLRAPGAGDNYTLPRPIAGANITVNFIFVSGSYNVGVTDNGKLFYATNTASIYLPNITSVPVGFNIRVKNANAGNSPVTLYNYTVGQYIDGLNNFTIRPSEAMSVVSNGTAWYVEGLASWGSSSQSLGYARPSATGQLAVALGSGSSASGAYSAALGYGASATAQFSTAGIQCTASALYTTAIGQGSGSSSSLAVSTGAMALNGRAGGTSSTALGIDTSSSTYGAQSTQSASIGYYSKAGASYATSIGRQSQATGTAAIALGNGYNVSGPLAQGSSAIALGDGSIAQATFSTAINAGSRASVTGQYSYACGFFNDYGDAQYSRYVLRRTTLDALATTLTTDGTSSGVSSNQVQLYFNNTLLAFKGLIIATSGGSGFHAAWEVSGAIQRTTSAATTVLLASTVNSLYTSNPALAVALSADVTYGTLKITITGLNGVNIKWVANIDAVMTSN